MRIGNMMNMMLRSLVHMMGIVASWEDNLRFFPWEFIIGILFVGSCWEKQFGYGNAMGNLTGG